MPLGSGHGPAQPERPSADGIADLVAAVRERYLPVLVARLATLETAAGQWAAGKLAGSAREEAVGAAHDLAGALDTFSIGGSDAARRLEALFGAGPSAADPEALERDLTVVRRALHPG